MSELYPSNFSGWALDRHGMGKSKIMNIFRPLDGSVSQHKRSKLEISAPAKSSADEFNTTSPHLDNYNAFHKTKPVFLDVLHDYLPNDDNGQQGLSSRTELCPLNVFRGEVVRLIAIADNNLVHVLLMNRLGQGLVPLRCVAINKSLSQGADIDFALHKLEQKPDSDSPSSVVPPYKNVSENSHTSLASLSMANEDFTSTISSCRVVNITIQESRVRYRLDCMMHSGHHRLLCRYYQDFYSLQLQLLDSLRKDGNGSPIKSLPALPSPTTNISQENHQDRCNLFNVYLDSLLESVHIPIEIKRGVLFDKWLSPRPGDVVKTPQGVLYQLYGSDKDGEGMAWDEISPEILEETVFQGQPFFEHGDWSNDFKGSSISGIRQRSFSSLSLPSSQKNLKPTNKSAPATPIMPQPPMFVKGGSYLRASAKDLSVKLKILHDGNCYVSKYPISELNSFNKLYMIVHSRIMASLPSVDHPLAIYHKDEKNNLTSVTNNNAYQVILSSVKQSIAAAFNSPSDLALNRCRLTIYVKS